MDEFSSFAEPGIVYVPSVPNFDETDHTLPQPGEDDDLTIEVISAGLAIQIDEVSDTVTYVGRAQPGTVTGAGAWQIQRLTEVGEDLAVQWANGSAEFNLIWDSRLSYIYS